MTDFTHHPTLPQVFVDGIPVPMGRKPTTAKGAVDYIMHALSAPYAGDDPDLCGKSLGEAVLSRMIRDAVNGDKDARKELLDRLMGRPTQTVQSLSVTASLEEFLDKLQAPQQESEEEAPWD